MGVETLLMAAVAALWAADRVRVNAQFKSVEDRCLKCEGDREALWKALYELQERMIGKDAPGGKAGV